MKKALSILAVIALTAGAAPIIYIGGVEAQDMDPETRRKVNEVFLDVWSEKTVFKNLENIPRKNVSSFVQSLNLNDSDKVVTATIMELGTEKLLRVDVYNANGSREHVSREKISAISDIYTPMIRTREGYYAPIEESSSKIKGSSKHQFGWSLTLGAGIDPEGYTYYTVEDGDTIQHDPYSLALIDIAIIDAIGHYHDHYLSLLLHFNIRADMAIALGYSKAFMAKYPHSPTLGIEVGLNKMIIDNYMGIENENLLGENDGLTVTPKMGVILFRDQKINLFADIAYTWIISEREAHYPSVRFGMSSYWGKKLRRRN